MGRDPGNVLPLAGAAYPGVSSFHCKISLVEGELMVEDLNSKNGTLVDGEAVTKKVLRKGSILTLGAGGPRFAVLGAGRNDETLMMKPESKRKGQRFGTDTVRMMREELGISAREGVGEMLNLQRRRIHRVVYVMGASLALVLAVAIWALNQLGDEAVAELRVHLREEIAEQELAWKQEAEALQRDFDARRTQLEQDRERLTESVRELEAGERVASGALRELSEQLAVTNEALRRFDPVNLENNKLGEVQRVGHSVVLVEVRMTYREQDSGKLLYRSRSKYGKLNPNTEDLGEEFARESTGSGFCLSKDGWILTNAHVAMKKGERDSILDGPLVLTPEVELRVVFSGTDRRHDATLMEWRSEGNEDLALLKIEPFAGMPHLPPLDLDAPLPPQGTEVFLVGFPLGNQALQQGDTVLASAFRGIVSRHVEDFLQVDAAVHPGASGGPVIDGQGRVIGVVVGMQATDRFGGASSAMGFIIPIGEAAALWPRKK